MSVRSVLLVSVLIVAGSSIQAQNFNVTRLSRLDQHAGYNDIWGYTAPDGREYALLGVVNGLAVINATDPVHTYEVGFFPGPQCTWRDIKTWGTYAYEVNDCLGGVRVIDMSNPEAPQLVNEFGFSSIVHAHNVQIDPDTGMLYAVGTSQGMVIFDLSVDPVNPPIVKTWNGQGIPGANGYVHDVQVSNGRAHAGLIYAGLYAMLDVSSLPNISVMATKPTGSDFTHSTWTSADGQVLVTADEDTGNRNLEIWDLSDPADPEVIAKLSQGGSTIPHNPFIRDQVVHVSYYGLGYLAFDISDPANPKKVGQFDTSPAGGVGLFSGAWGCYPFTESGVVYVSDMQRGLFCLTLNDPCPPDTGGRPTICSMWPEVLDLGGNGSQTILLSGATLSNVTSVSVNGVTIPGAEFTALDDQVLAMEIAAPPAGGLATITLANAAGSSDPVYLPLRQPGAPVLDSGAQGVAVGGEIGHLLQSGAAGDLQFLAFSVLPLPSVVPGKVSFDIGDAFTNFFLLGALPAGPGGLTSLTGISVPPSAAGMTVFWQYAVVDASGTLPRPMSNVSVHVIGP
ncbi:MAG: LVIVD repeat-containing protein [Planctomycetota bacterium]|jgi:choice-of-anchor B domain-containing protein